MLKTGRQHIEQLRDGRVVFLNGETVDDVTTHPAFRNAVATVGRLYDRYGATRLLVPGAIIVSAVMWALTLVDQHTSIWGILIGHIAISVGLALVFTPLFTASLSSVPMQLYSHGSAIIGTVQQVAGAVGTALFVTVMSIQSAALAADGSAGTVAVAGGVRAAFLAGAIISVFAVAAAFFVRKPADNQTADHEAPEHQATASQTPDSQSASPAESADALADGR